MLGNNTSKRRILNIGRNSRGARSFPLAPCSRPIRRPASINLQCDVEIPGSENIPNVSIGEFLGNTVENTGVNAIVNGSEEVPTYRSASRNGSRLAATGHDGNRIPDHLSGCREGL